MTSKQDFLEESLLLAADMIVKQADDQASKIIAELFKSTVLEKYKEAYVKEVSQGKVHKKNIRKAVDFLFADMCVSFRNLPGMTDDFKDTEIEKAKRDLGTLKEMVCKALVNKGVEVIAEDE